MTNAVQLVLLVGGLALVLLATYDTTATVLAVSSSAGPVSGWLSRRVWRLVLALPRQHLRHRVLRRIGPLTLLLTLAVWLALAWAGWACVLASSTASVRLAAGHGAAPLGERILFAGASIIGRVQWTEPGSGVWRVVALAASLHGIFMLSLSVSYLVPVASAVAEKRKLAGHISTLGTSPVEIVLQAWNGRDFGELHQHLIALVPDVSLLAQRHLAYPLVHYFHSSARVWAAAPALAGLDDALTLLWYGVEPDRRPDAVALRTLRTAILELLDTLRADFLRTLPEAPPAPDLGAVRRGGVPVVDDAAFREDVETLSRRRALLRALVEHDGWQWDDVVMANPDSEPTVDDDIDPSDEAPLRKVLVSDLSDAPGD